MQKSDLNTCIKISEKNHLLFKKIDEIILNSLDASDIKEARKKILEEIGKTFNCDRCYIRFFDYKQKKFIKIDKYSEYVKSLKVKGFSDYDFPLEFYEMINHFEKINPDNHKEDVICFPNWEAEFLKFGEENVDLVKKLAEEFSIKSVYRSLIKNGSEIIGTFIIHYTEDFVHLAEEDIKAIEIVSRKLAYILKQTELLDINKQRKERELSLIKIIGALRQSLNINETKKNLVTEIGKALEADRVFLVSFDPEINTPQILDEYSEYLSSSNQVSLVGFDFASSEVDFFTDIHKETKSIIIEDIKKYIEENKLKNTSIEKWLSYIKLKTGIGVTISYDKKIYGVLAIHYTKSTIPVTEEYLEFVGALRDQVGIALYQANLYTSLKKSMQMEKLLAEIITIIKSNLNPDEVFLVICSFLTNFYNVKRIIISKINDKEKNLNILKECCKKNEGCRLSLKSKEYLYKKIIKNKSFIVNDVEKINCPRYFRKDFILMNIKSLIMVPIIFNTIETGAIIIQDDKINKWRQEDVKFLLRVADYISIAIKESNLYNQSEFISNVSHELKTPLSIISGYSDLLLSHTELDYKTTNKFLYTIKNNSERLNKLIDNLLFISNMEKNFQYKNIVFEKLNVINLIENSIQLCEEKIKSKNVKIEKNVKNIIIKKANTILLQQLIINLITNAINYSESGSTIKLNAEKNDKEILISVEDNGCGIKKEHLPNIFERFYRADRSRSRETGGTGIGLSISKLISEIHDGYITVKSIFGKGSIFILHLPD